ncbi:MAG: alkaline phosphatase D [Arenicella sp.]|jgi:alkaline phosphatase D
MPNINRRTFITGLTGISSLSFLGNASAHQNSPFTLSYQHGVASGDPLQTRVILWTRISFEPSLEQKPGTRGQAIRVQWQVSNNAQFTDIVSQGFTSTNANRDYTIKVDADHLKPDSGYFYRFICNQVISPIGRTRTLAAHGSTDNDDNDVSQTQQAELAVVSCSNYGYGYFNVYQEISQQTNLTAVLHLGDYIYEYANDVYSDPELANKQRSILPLTEITRLEDYRKRYNIYRLDSQLQAAHAAHPFICIWDDHEFANDSWQDGAQNHQADEGSWEQRRQVAIQAYREWLPIRDPLDNDHSEIAYRRFDIGSLASLIMLDTRIVGRSKPVDYLSEIIWQQHPFDIRPLKNEQDPVAITSEALLASLSADEIKMITVPFDMSKNPPQPVLDWALLSTLDLAKLEKPYALIPDAKRIQAELLDDPQRQLLGDTQEQWLSSELQDSKQKNIPWQILGQQILMGNVCMPDVTKLVNYKKGLSAATINAIVGLGKLNIPYNTDAWDGYNANRQRVLKSFKQDANNVISLAGDTHNSWAFDLTPSGESKSVAVEMATASVSSPGLENYLSNDNPEQLSSLLIEHNPQLIYQNSHQRGWLKLTITAEATTGQWRYVSTVKSKQYENIIGPSYTVAVGSHSLSLVEA